MLSTAVFNHPCYPILLADDHASQLIITLLPCQAVLHILTPLRKDQEDDKENAIQKMGPSLLLFSPAMATVSVSVLGDETQYRVIDDDDQPHDTYVMGEKWPPAFEASYQSTSCLCYTQGTGTTLSNQGQYCC